MYNVLAEIAVAILSGIMLINFLSSFTLKEKRHILFFFCILTVFASTLVNIWSTALIAEYKPENKFLATAVTTLYFLLLCSPSVLFSFYTYTFASLNKKHEKLVKFSLHIPNVLFILIVLSNVKTGWLFYYDDTLGYVRGPLKNITYVTTAIYIIYCLLIALHNRKTLTRKVFFVLCAYPVLSMAIISIQFFHPYLIMTGVTAMAPMFLTYLTIQSDFLDYDLTTGLLTEQHLSNTINQSKNSNLIVISLENYNTIYENQGYVETNFLLFKIARKISASFPKDAYHISTDRFAVLGSNMDKMRESILKICKDIQNFQADENRLLHIETRCVGVKIPENAKNYSNAMELVSEMLSNSRKSKIKGDKHFFLCDEIYEEKVRRINMIQDILERELNVDSHMYQVYFQPIYSIKKEKFVYAEALSRLIDTEIGTIRPDEFIAVAETRGLIEKLGNVAFEKICKFISEHKETVQAVSVNFSVNQLSNPYIVENVLSTINKYGIKPENIIMEITESIFIDDLESIKERMIRLADAGIIFYLDDFGTGYSNFANVVELPFSTIKFDRSMVLSMESKEESRSLISSLISAFKQSGLKILMEGVENQTQDKMVREAGADLIQGFLYKRPVCEQEALEVLA